MKIGYFEVDKLHEYETFLQAIAVVSPRARCGETALYKFLLYLCYSKTTDGDVVAFTFGAAHWNQVGYRLGKMAGQAGLGYCRQGVVVSRKTCQRAVH